MVLPTGYDPVIRVPQTRVLPLHQGSMEESPRFELGPQGFAVPLISRFAMTPLCMGGREGFEPSSNPKAVAAVSKQLSR